MSWSRVLGSSSFHLFFITSQAVSGWKYLGPESRNPAVSIYFCNELAHVWVKKSWSRVPGSSSSHGFSHWVIPYLDENILVQSPLNPTAYIDFYSARVHVWIKISWSRFQGSCGFCRFLRWVSRCLGENILAQSPGIQQFLLIFRMS